MSYVMLNAHGNELNKAEIRRSTNLLNDSLSDTVLPLPIM